MLALLPLLGLEVTAGQDGLLGLLASLNRARSMPALAACQARFPGAVLPSPVGFATTKCRQLSGSSLQPVRRECLLPSATASTLRAAPSREATINIGSDTSRGFAGARRSGE